MQCSAVYVVVLRILHNNIHPWDNIALQLRDGAPSSAGHRSPGSCTETWL